MLLGYLGIDQYGVHYNLKKYPRKELLNQLGYKFANKMYVDLKNGGSRFNGYVIGGLWIKILEVHAWSKGA